MFNNCPGKWLFEKFPSCYCWQFLVAHSPGIGTGSFLPLENQLVCRKKGRKGIWKKEEKIFLELQEDDCSYQISLREKLTRVKEVKSGAQESHKGKETKLQNKGDWESCFFHFITPCRDIAWPHTWLCFCALEASRHRVWVNAGFGGRGWLGAPRNMQTLTGTVQAFADSGPGAWVLFDHSKIPPLEGCRWKSGQKSWADASVNALRNQSPENPQPVCALRISSWEGQGWNSCCPPAALPGGCLWWSQLERGWNPH